MKPFTIHFFFNKDVNFLAGAEPELNDLIIMVFFFWRFESETFLTMFLTLIVQHFSKS